MLQRVYGTAAKVVSVAACKADTMHQCGKDEQCRGWLQRRLRQWLLHNARMLAAKRTCSASLLLLLRLVLLPNAPLSVVRWCRWRV